MPIRLWIAREEALIRAEVWGSCSMEEITANITKAAQNSRFQPGFNILSDHTGITDPLTVTQATGMVHHIQSFARHFRHAKWAVITRDPASFGVIRMVSVLAQEIPMEVRAFTTTELAKEWLAQED